MKFKGFFLLATSTVLVISLLLVMAYNQAWQYHLAVDVWGFYFRRANHFLQNLSFANIGINEYFPGAMFFFLIPTFIYFFRENIWQNYLYGLFIINFLLIIFHLYIYRGHSFRSPFIFLMILLFAGPIMLFRHDLYVSLFVLEAILLWNSKKYNLSSFILGIAASIKIYPFLILPYFLIGAFKIGALKKLFKSLTFFLIGVASVFSLYLLLGATLTDLKSTLTINSIKPVHVESLWGSMLTIFSKITVGYWAPGKGANGLFGIHEDFIILPLSFYNYFWVVPLFLFYWYLGQKRDLFKEIRFEIVFLIVLLFEIFSKILTAQYLFWFLTLFPTFSLNFQKKPIYWFWLTIILIIVLLTQIIYPLRYNELLINFYTNQTNARYFYLLLLRNILLLALFISVFKIVFGLKTTKFYETFKKD